MFRKSRIVATILMTALAFGGAAQAAVSSFDDLPPLPASGYYAGGSTGTGDADYFFTSGSVTYKQVFSDYLFDNCCQAAWTYSRLTDTTTPGSGNQFSAYAGSGQGGSANYGLANVPYSGPLEATYAAPSIVGGAYFTNTTYTALSMLNGDGFSKKFGGSSGNDADYFLLTISGYNDQTSTGSVDFYLADYRFSDNSKDYVVKDWTFVDLSSLGTVTKLEFALSSSDTGAFGMNTPAYLAMDSMSVTAVPEPEQAAMLLAGLALLGGFARKRARAARAARAV